jgi:hypothetical protein
MTAAVVDYFSSAAPDYERYRPRYPAALFDLIDSLALQHECAWDCGTGTGQAAGPLRERFRIVLASDVSSAQLRNAALPPGVGLFAARAEQVPLRDACVDVITVAQALHWFDLDAFFADTVTEAVDAVMQAFYRDVIGPYWPPERRFVDDAYASITLPLSEPRSKSMPMSTEWTVEHLLHYIGTWSAVKCFRDARSGDPVALLSHDLRAAWGTAHTRCVNWSMTVKTGRRA